MTLPVGWFALACRPWHPGGGAQHRDAGQRGVGAPLRGSAPAAKTADQACADLPTARACGSIRHRGHLGHSPRPVRLHSASPGCAPRGSLPDVQIPTRIEPLTECPGGMAHTSLLATQVLSQERSHRRTTAAAPPAPTVDRVLHTSWGHIPRRRQPPPGLVVRASSMAPFQGVFPREALCSWRGMAGSRDGETPSRIQHNGGI